MVKWLNRLFMFGVVATLIGAVAYAAIKPDAMPQFGGRRAAGDNAVTGKAGRGGNGGAPVPVLVASVASKNVPVILEGVGTARALKSVTVRPQVDGKILRIPFREGQEVKAGDVIAEIDPATYKAQLDQLVARRALTQTQLDNARRDLERYNKIPGVVAQKTVDTQRAQVEQLEAQLKADSAAIDNAEIVLGYTRITAPIAGRVGMRMVDEGNLVRSSDAGIAVITQIKPISVLFTLPQQRLAEVNRAMARGSVAVEAMDANSRTVLDSGTLQVVDNQVDQQTGTVKMKADFPNANLQLWPGQFANVRVQVDTLSDVLAIPVAAVQRGPSGTFAYVVNDEQKVEMRPITLGLVTETEAVVTAGLSSGAVVVTSGFARLTDGAAVAVQAAPEVPQVKAPGPTAGRGEGRGRGRGEGTGEGRRRRSGEAANRAEGAQSSPRGNVQ